MSELNLAAPFLTHVRRAVDRLPKLQILMKKVNKLLRDYAEKRRGLSLVELTILDVCDNEGELHHELLDFIKRLPHKKQYKQSQTSNIRRLVRTVLNGDQVRRELGSDGGWDKGFIVSNLPPFMRDAWLLLPKARVAGGVIINMRTASMNDDQRSRIPLSKMAEGILKAMIKVAAEEQVNTLAALLVDHGNDVLMKMMEELHPSQESPAKRCLKRLCIKLGYVMPKPAVYSLRLEELPDKLKAEVRLFQDWAPHGIESMPHLEALAAEFDVSSKPLKQSTIENYVKGICYGFGFIEWSGDLGVEDLLQLQPITRTVNGRTYGAYYNPYVEQFRQRERDRVSPHKRKGKDSVMFGHFFEALCTIAAFNGVFEMQTLFKQAYRPKLDMRRRKDIKNLKKKVYDRPWLDGQIRLLGEEIGRIISDKTYVLMPEERETEEAMDNLRKCMFYVTLVTLRYTGFRQQCVRNCVFGENIIFNPDGSVTFWYPEKAIKNAKEIDTTYSYAEHGETHGALIDALRGHREVYEYIAEVFGGEMEWQFFGRVLTDTVKAHKTAREFTHDFEDRGLQFLDFGGRVQKAGFKLNPHFLRGFAIDWMYQKLGMSKEDIARVVGCTVKVIEREYMGEERKVDSGKLLAEVNKKIRKAKQEEAEALTPGRGGRSDHGVMRQLEASRVEAARAKERARRAEEKVKVLESKLRDTGEGVASSGR